MRCVHLSVARLQAGRARATRAPTVRRPPGRSGIGRRKTSQDSATGAGARGPIAVFVLELTLVMLDRLMRAAELALQGVEVSEMGVVLELPCNFLLLCLGTAAPHGSTPSLTS